MKFDVIIVGSGFAGSTLARKFALDNKKVLIYEKRGQIGGNMYDKVLDNSILVHQYGPHIFHTNSKKVMDFVTQFGSWYFYEHKVVGKINNTLVPIPFNFKSLELLYSKEQADIIKEKLLAKYKDTKKVSILDLINDSDETIKQFGLFVYKNVFENYTAKQWNIPIEEIDTSVINRVPVILGYDDRYFQDEYQYMPKHGYTKVFEEMLNHPNITIKLNTNALEDIEIKDNKIYWQNQEFHGKVFYTGAIDELFNYKYGPLPYRSLDLVFENYDMNYYQSSAVVNYPNDEKYTRITEFKYLSNQLVNNKTTILKEYPKKYDYQDENSIPYYLYMCGRLAEYKYFNMDAVILRALELYEKVGK